MGSVFRLLSWISCLRREMHDTVGVSSCWYSTFPVAMFLVALLGEWRGGVRKEHRPCAKDDTHFRQAVLLRKDQVRR